MAIRFTHLRHATSILDINNRNFLIDPMLAEKETLKPVILTQNKLKNPRVDFPKDVTDVVGNSDYVLLTHLHFDHFDKTAISEIPKSKRIICSDIDSKKLTKLGFKELLPINRELDMDDITIHRYPATHGTGLLKYALGNGSSYLIDYGGFKIFLTGDCILNQTLKKNLSDTNPNVIIANGGAARFKFGKPITMSIEDIIGISNDHKNSKIIAVHLDTINHCVETRKYCKKQTDKITTIYIPNNGETIELD